MKTIACKWLLLALLGLLFPLMSALAYPTAAPTVQMNLLPGAKGINLQMTEMAGQSATIRLQDELGTLVSEEIVQGNPDAHVKLWLNKLPTGTYYISIEMAALRIERCVSVESGRTTFVDEAELQYKPVFKVEGNQLTVMFFGPSQQGVEVKLKAEDGSDLLRETWQHFPKAGRIYALPELGGRVRRVEVRIQGKEYKFAVSL